MSTFYSENITSENNLSGLTLNISTGFTSNLYATDKITGNTISMANLIYIENKSDFPEPVGGVITLDDNKTYFVNTTVDLLGDRLVAGQNTTILGGSSENCRLKSTGLSGTALLSSNWTIPMRGLTIEADVALNLDATGNANQAIDWFGVNFTNCNTIGLINNYSNIIWTDCAILEGADLTFSGTIATVGFVTCLFNGTAGKSIFNIPNGCSITRRFRPIYSSFVTLAGETGITVNSASIVNNDGFILDTVNFAGGGTYLAGIDATSSKALLINNVGVLNSSNLGHMYMINNTTDTTIGIPNVNVWVKAAGTTTAGDNNSPRFTHTTNRLTYTGNVRSDFVITSTATVRSSSNNQVISIGIAKNSTIINDSETTIRTTTANQEYPGSSQTVLEMTTGDFIEFFVRNTNSTNIRVSDLSVIINKIPA
jgi:hypothetical protein